MFERDEIDDIKAQMKLLKYELRALQSRLSALEQQNLRLFDENRALHKLATFRQPENTQTIDIQNISNISTENQTAVFTPQETQQTIDVSSVPTQQATDVFSVQTPTNQAEQAPLEEQTAPAFRQPEPENDIAAQYAHIKNNQKHNNITEQTQSKTQSQTRRLVIKNSVSENNNALIDWLTGGNVLLKTGVLVLFLGLAFLLRYVGGAMPMPLRYLAVFAAGIAAAVGGEYLQAKRRDYGLILQGFGFGVMYLTALAAVKLHNLLPHNIALIVMVISVALMAWRAVVKDAKILAQVAVIGGLFAPILTSDGTGSHIALFAYLAVLNTGVAAIAWFKAWRSLNLIGAIGTLWIALLWSKEYSSDLFTSCEFFLIYHWLLYTLIACFFAYRSLEETPMQGELREIPNNATLERIWQTIVAYGSHIKILDSSLLFGTALSTFGLQYAMVKHWENAAAYSAMLWAAVYGGLAWYYARQNKDFAVMKQAFVLLSGLFVTLAIPLALEQQWTASAWALEAALVYVFGLSQKQPHVRLGALGVFALAAFKQLKGISIASHNNHLANMPMLDGSAMGAFLVMISGAAMYYFWHTKHRSNSAKWEENAFLAVSVLTLLNTITLPLLSLKPLYCLPLLSFIAAGLAFLQWQQKNIVFTVFSSFAIFAALFCMTQTDFDPNGIYVFCAALWILSAYLLHNARWKDQTDKRVNTNNLFGIFNLWIALPVAIMDIEQILRVQRETAFSLSSLLVWLFLIVFATWRGWKIGTYSAVLLGLISAISMLDQASSWGETHLLSGSLIIIFATSLALFTLFRLPEKTPDNRANKTSHFLLSLFYISLWSVFLSSATAHHFPALRPLGALMAPLVAWAIYIYRNQYFAPYEKLYLNTISTLLAIFGVLWLIKTNFTRPAASLYIPLINPIEIGSIAVLSLLWQWQKNNPSENEDNEDNDSDKIVYGTIALSGLLVLSCAVMRFWHYYNGIDWNAAALLASFGVQATLSIIWAITAIVIMVWANRQQRRTLWIAGASLMGVVVCKLFLVELANSNGIERIISFIAVGLLLLFVGWFAPVPPKKDDDITLY